MTLRADLRRRSLPPLLALFAALGSVACAQVPGPETGGDWPQWRGPNRDNRSPETGLLKEWPPEGPPLAWETRGIGGGISAVAVSGGRVFLLGDLQGVEYATALEEGTGRRLWTSPLGPEDGRSNPLMRWLAQRTPTVDAERVYAFRSTGVLVCLGTDDGRERWRRDYTADFGHLRPFFGSADYPLVDGERLICAVGGNPSSLVALDRRTGAVIWKTAVAGAGRGTHGEYGATVVAEVGGRRQFVAHLRQGLCGFDAEDGRLLWRLDDGDQRMYTGTPIVLGERLLVPGRHSAARQLVRLSPAEAVVENAWRSYVSFSMDTALVEGGRLHLLDSKQKALTCLDAVSGREIVAEHDLGKGTFNITWSDGRLYALAPDGTVSLIEAAPDAYRLRGRFKILPWAKAMGASSPVVAGGRLYIRDDDRLLAYAVREGARPEPSPPRLLPPPGREVPGAPRAAFVPTPADVVGRMLDLAELTEKDVLVDLGSGDGRIVTAAAKRGARALGVEIDATLADTSRKAAAAAGVADRVRIVEGDLFDADLSEATIVALYLPPEILERLAPRLARLQPGVRIVSHQFRLPGRAPDASISADSLETGSAHQIHLYRMR